MNELDKWAFLEKYHPNYTGEDNIAFISDLDRYLAGEYDPEDPRYNATRMARAFPDRLDAEIERERLYCQEMLRAINVYQSRRYPDGILPY